MIIGGVLGARTKFTFTGKKLIENPGGKFRPAGTGSGGGNGLAGELMVVAATGAVTVTGSGANISVPTSPLTPAGWEVTNYVARGENVGVESWFKIALAIAWRRLDGTETEEVEFIPPTNGFASSNTNRKMHVYRFRGGLAIEAINPLSSAGSEISSPHEQNASAVGTPCIVFAAAVGGGTIGSPSPSFSGGAADEMLQSTTTTGGQRSHVSGFVLHNSGTPPNYQILDGLSTPNRQEGLVSVMIKGNT